MINLRRPEQTPPSLRTAEIGTYQEQLARHQADPKQNPAPATNPPYRGRDLLAIFTDAFHAKCYLTEEWFPTAWSMDVDHFIPVNEAPEKKYDWHNLFPASHDANMARPRKTPEGGYLNPCTDDVETEILCTAGLRGMSPRFKARNKNHLKAVNTAALLDRLHQGSDPDSIEKTKRLRHAIQEKYETVLNTILAWQVFLKQGNEPGALEKENELRMLLSRKKAFTMLLRSMPAVRQHVPKDFLD